MKKFCLFFVGIIAFVLISCEEKIPPKPTGIRDFNYVYKKKQGKILTGVEKELARGKTKNIIPIKYEKITAGFNNTFFLVYQGNEAKVVNEEGKLLFDGMSIKPESIKFLGDKNYMALGNAYRFENTAGQKYWWFMSRYLFTGYDDLIPCVNGFVYKKNNKYGFAEFSASHDGLKASNQYTIDQEFKVTVPEKYEALYEITNNLGIKYYFLLAKKENKWVVLNNQGHLTKNYPASINKNLVLLPIKDKIEKDWNSNIIGERTRLGQKDAGLITFTMKGRIWNTYFR